VKPWRPYWKGLDLLMGELLRSAEPPPFSIEKVGQWIENLKFDELSFCDSDCDGFIEDLANGSINSELVRCSSFGVRNHWQLILRCECALDFCRGRVEKRNKFNWQQDPIIIYRWLLIEFWRRDALHWASKIHSSNEIRKVLRQRNFTSEFFYRFRDTDPTKN